MADKKKPPFGNMPPKQNSDGKGNNRPKFYWVYIGLLAVFLGYTLLGFDTGAEEISWGQFKEMLTQADVDKILLVNKESAEIFIKSDKISNYPELSKGTFKGSDPHYIYTIGSVDKFYENVEAAQELITEPVYIRNVNRRNWARETFSIIVPILILIGAWILIMRMMAKNVGGGGAGGQIFNIGKSKAKLFDDADIKISFKDVAGLEEAKIEIMEIVDFLKNPSRYTDLGGKIPKGALLVGPPGTGKTLLAKAVAGEAKVPFFSLSGSDFVEMFVGVGASRVRDLFKQAKEKAPSIIFIDEIDAIGRARGKNAMTGANDERENTLNQLLTEMDGFGTNQGVIILAATNRADILDRALLRAGRFDRQIHVELPDLNERAKIFGVHIKPLKINKDSVNKDFMAKQTPGFSGADIANVCNEAALICARKGKKMVDRQDFMDAVDRIVGGLEKKNKIISVGEKKAIAYHEAGHASVSWLLEHAHPLVKVTIIPRGKALGAAWYLPEERQITTTEQMFDEITSLLAGRASEEIHFGKISTGALNDLEKATKQAYAMVSYFGLNDIIGNVSYYDSTGQQEYSFHKPYSEKTAEAIDKEVSKLIEKAYSRAKKVILENKDKVTQLGDLLLKNEVIYSDDVKKIFGERAGSENLPDSSAFISEDINTTLAEEKQDNDQIEEKNPTNENKEE